MLDALGKRYVVECGQSGDAWYERYSDGFIRQGGVYIEPEHTRSVWKVLPFPIEFSEKVSVVITPIDLSNDEEGFINCGASAVRTELNQFEGKVYGFGSSDTMYGFNWTAEGY